MSEQVQTEYNDDNVQDPLSEIEFYSTEMLRRASSRDMLKIIKQVTESVNPDDELGNCIGKEQFFFPEAAEGSRVVARKEQIAKALCKTCPIVAKCLDDALSLKVDSGIWGGLNEEERRSLSWRRQY